MIDSLRIFESVIATPFTNISSNGRIYYMFTSGQEIPKQQRFRVDDGTITRNKVWIVYFLKLKCRMRQAIEHLHAAVFHSYFE